ncbi:hypothetical protein ACFL0W_03390 [Nanoarchaeota archaeon]
MGKRTDQLKYFFTQGWKNALEIIQYSVKHRVSPNQAANEICEREKSDYFRSITGDMGRMFNPPSPEEIEAKARDSIEKILSYFSEQGLDLGYIPTVKYTGEPNPFLPIAAASVAIERDFHKVATSYIATTMIKTLFEDQFGLFLSKESLDETMSVAAKELETRFSNELDYGDSNILLHKPIEGILFQMDEVIAHEIWHLIEERYGVLDLVEMIHEGTATYVQNRFANRPCAWEGSEADFIENFYNNVAYIVQEEVGNNDNPLQTILNPDVRDSLKSQFEGKILPIFYLKAADLIKLDVCKQIDIDTIRNHPAYEGFRNNPTAENLLAAMSDRGYVKLANNIREQDLTRYVAYHVEFLKQE